MEGMAGMSIMVKRGCDRNLSLRVRGCWCLILAVVLIRCRGLQFSGFGMGGEWHEVVINQVIYLRL